MNQQRPEAGLFGDGIQPRGIVPIQRLGTAAARIAGEKLERAAAEPGGFPPHMGKALG